MSGLYYLRARYHDPVLGRFWTQDPWGGSAASPQTLNPYPYVGSNPVLFVDPTGLCEWNWDLMDKLDCPREAAEWAVDYVSSPWNQANFVQGLGYLLLVTCETGIGCAAAGSVILFSWSVKLEMICDQISSGEISVKEGSKKFLISLIPSPTGDMGLGPLGPGLGAGARKVIGLLPGDVYFDPLESCK